MYAGTKYVINMICSNSANLPLKRRILIEYRKDLCHEDFQIILGILCVLCFAGGAYYVRESKADVDTEGPKLEAASDTIEVSIEDPEETLLQDVAATTTGTEMFRQYHYRRDRQERGWGSK